MRAIDTNVVVRLIVRDDEKQVRAAESFVAQGAWISSVVLVETYWVLRSVYGRSHADILAAFEILLDLQQLAIEQSDIVQAALQQYRLRPALGFSDCLALEIARKAGHLPLGTFDKALAKAEGERKEKFEVQRSNEEVKKPFPHSSFELRTSPFDRVGNDQPPRVLSSARMPR